MSERMWEELQETRAERDRLRRELEAYQARLERRAAGLRLFSAPSLPGGDLASHAAEVQKIADELARVLRGESIDDE